MKPQLIWNLVVIWAISASAAYASNVGVDLNIHLGNQPKQVIVREPLPPPPPPRIVSIEEDVNFIYPEALGFYVAVGVPYDLFYVQNNYYLFRDGSWQRASRSRGPWVAMKRRDLPPGLRRQQIERIRAYRNEEYDNYRGDREHYRGKHFLSSKEEWKEQRKEDKEQWKEEKRAMKEERKHHQGRKHDND